MGPSRVDRDFEKRSFEPVNNRTLCVRAGDLLPVR